MTKSEERSEAPESSQRGLPYYWENSKWCSIQLARQDLHFEVHRRRLIRNVVPIFGTAWETSSVRPLKPHTRPARWQRITTFRIKQENLDVESIYVNCGNDHSRFQLLFRILTEVDERLTSRLRSAEHIRFHKYTTDELVDILRERADRALAHDAISRSELELIADEAGGDARVAIATLKLAARQADRDNPEQITTDHVKQAVPDAREELRQKNLDALSEHQRKIYEIIEEHESIAPGDLYSEYRSRVDNPKSDRTVRSYQILNLGSTTGALEGVVSGWLEDFERNRS